MMMPRVGMLKYLFVSPFLFLFCLVSSCPRFFEFEPRTRPIQTHMARSQCCGYRKLYVAPGRTTKSLSPFSLSLHCAFVSSCPLFITPGRTATSLSIHFVCLLNPIEACSGLNVEPLFFYIIIEGMRGGIPLIDGIDFLAAAIINLSCPRFFASGRNAKISLSPLFFKSRRALVSSPLVEPRNMSLSLPIPFSRLVVSSSLRPGLDCELSLSLFFVLLAVRNAVSAVAKGAGRWAVAGHALVLRHARGEGPSSMPPALACPAAASGVPLGSCRAGCAWGCPLGARGSATQTVAPPGPRP